MINVNLIVATQQDLEYIQDYHGLLIFVKDKKTTYYVNKNLTRLDISLNTICLKSESELQNIISPILSRIYIVEDTCRIYKYSNRWEEVTNEDTLLGTIENSIDLTPSILFKDDKFMAPKTLASNVYMGDGSLLSAHLSSSPLTVTKTKSIYVQAEIDNQRVFTIPYPITNYDLYRNHISIFVRGDLLSTDKYVINNEKLILSSTIQPLNIGDTVLFIFYYSILLDMNDNVVLTTKHYEDLSITTEKLSPDIMISANNIYESPRRVFMTPAEREKLNNIDYGATRFIHPDTHPASMIVTDPERRFISDEQLADIDKKAYIRDVYTKQETLQKIEEIIGSAPDTLNTLRELAEALGNDPNFATTILEKLNDKADNIEIEEINTELETKVNVTDYLKTGIYNTPRRIPVLDVDEYSISVDDLKLNEYIDGLPVTIKITETNRGPSTLRINNLEPKPILTQDLQPLIAKELKVGSIYTLRFNGTTGNFLLQGKGGVNLLNTTQTEYLADQNEIITRGDLLDIVNGKARVSIPRCNLMSSYESNGNKFNCDGRIETICFDNDRFVTIWKDGDLLKVYPFSVQQLEKHILQGDLDQNDPIIFDLLCKEFSVTKITETKFVITVVNLNNLVSSNVVTIDNNNITLGETKLFDDVYDEITNLRTIKVIKNRFIIGYQFNDKTRLMYAEVVDNSINVLSSRTNVDYLIENYCFINSEQILFSGSIDNKIVGWVMNIDDLDFYHTTLTTLFINEEDENESYTNVEYTLIGTNEIYSTFTNKDMTKQYSQFITVEFNGFISALRAELLYEDAHEIMNNLIPSRLKISDNLYLAPSNYDHTKDNIEKDNRDYIKITLEKMIDGKPVLLNKYTVLSDLYKDISFEMINDETLLLIYSSRNNNSEKYRLFFKVIEVKRKPDMVAISSGIQNESIKVVKW